MNAAEHYNPLLVTVLPKERRARHPYQLCVMLMLLWLAGSQLILGPVEGSAITGQSQAAQDMLNWFCVVAGVSGVVAAFIPERIVRWGFTKRFHYLHRLVPRLTFDATYFRLWEELACHLLLVTVWTSYFITVIAAIGIRGLTISSAAAIFLGIAAVWRCAEIWLTLYRAGTFSRKSSTIIGAETLDGQARNG